MSGSSSVLDDDLAWAVLRACVARARRGEPITDSCSLGVTRDGELAPVAAHEGLVHVLPDSDRGHEPQAAQSAAATELLDLYLPLCIGHAASRLVIAHVGQSLDGQIATASGASRYVTGPENLKHTHRLRALCDAVVIGATTADVDDPELTTRLVRGDNPTRVIIDRELRVPLERRIFQEPAAPTLVIHRSGLQPARRAEHVDYIHVPCRDGALAPADIVEALGRRGLRRLFVEGGGVTVSRFVDAGLLDRLHVTICPVLIGRGKPGLSLPPIDSLTEALRPHTRRFALGRDVLFDCSLGRSM